MRTTSRTESLTKLAKYGVTGERLDAAIALGQRWCSGCKDFTSDYYKSPTSRLCKKCSHEHSLEYARTHREKIRLRARQHYRENQARLRSEAKERRSKLSKEELRKIGREGTLRRYGLTTEQYEEMSKRQDGLCALCGKKPTNRQLCIDHDHKTKQNRGLLCTRCNIIVGWIEKHTHRIPEIQEYLKKFHANPGNP